MERLFTYIGRLKKKKVTPASSESNMRGMVLCKKLYLQKNIAYPRQNQKYVL